MIFLEETLVSSDVNIKALSRRWLHRSFWSPAIGKQGGVAILILPKCSDDIVSWKKDSNGRIISILVRICGVNLNFVIFMLPPILLIANLFTNLLMNFLFLHLLS